jgi:hypothetical protein
MSFRVQLLAGDTNAGVVVIDNDIGRVIKMRICIAT